METLKLLAVHSNGVLQDEIRLLLHSLDAVMRMLRADSGILRRAVGEHLLRHFTHDGWLAANRARHFIGR